MHLFWHWLIFIQYNYTLNIWSGNNTMSMKYSKLNFTTPQLSENHWPGLFNCFFLIANVEWLLSYCFPLNNEFKCICFGIDFYPSITITCSTFEAVTTHWVWNNLLNFTTLQLSENHWPGLFHCFFLIAKFRATAVW
jgi:hypothetical protein